jgi:hypothetical protein
MKETAGREAATTLAATGTLVKTVIPGLPHQASVVGPAGLFGL